MARRRLSSSSSSAIIHWNPKPDWVRRPSSSRSDQCPTRVVCNRCVKKLFTHKCKWSLFTLPHVIPWNRKGAQTWLNKDLSNFLTLFSLEKISAYRFVTT